MLTIFSRFRVFILTLFFALLVTSSLHLILDNYRVQGQSMEPSLDDQQYLLVNKFAYLTQGPQRGDIVIFRNPHNTNEYYIKRIIALPGDVVSIIHHHVMINTIPLQEPYAAPDEQDAPDLISWLISPNNYFVLGDNRGHSSDSRQWGLVPRVNILGKVTYRYWPLNVFGFLPDMGNVFARVPHAP